MALIWILTAISERERKFVSTPPKN